MATEALHNLTAAYALDALDPDERRDYEAHLARCGRCRDELASLSEAATSLAYAVSSPTPAPHLRERIIAAARAERPNVVPLRPRWAVPSAAVAVCAVAAVIVLAVWAASLSHKVDRLQAERADQEHVAAVLASPDAQSVSIGDRGKLVVTPIGEAALVLTRLQSAGSGHVYEAWVAENGKPKPAGTFQAQSDVTAVPLEQPVPKGATVMVTRERHAVDLPTQMPFIRVTA